MRGVVDMTGTEDHQLPLNPGTIVSVVADQTRIGSIVEELDPVGSKRRFRVFHSGSNYQDYFEDQIQVAKSATIDDSLIGLSNHAFTESNEFRVRMTAIRLSNPQTDSIYSLMAARVKFIPFQFKPLLRLLRSDRPRLLIADDVGVARQLRPG